MTQVLELGKGQYVKNVIGSSVATKGAKSYYEEHARWPEYCCAMNCKHPAVHGGHVKVSGGGEGGKRHYWSWFIVPVRQNPHNQPRSDLEFQVCSRTVAVEDSRVEFKHHFESRFHNLRK